MPTGYTADVADGTVTSLAEYAAQCARNFGALLDMRDLPKTAPIPDSFPVSDYYVERAEETKVELVRLECLSEEEQQSESLADYAAEMASYERRVKLNNGIRKNYEAMLRKVQKWTPPSPAHVGLKDFMMRQLIESKDFDDSPPDKPEKKPFEMWYRDELLKALRNRQSALENLTKESKRAHTNAQWISDLRNSLRPVKKTPAKKLKSKTPRKRKSQTSARHAH